jgi:C1A family cysteine protease
LSVHGNIQKNSPIDAALKEKVEKVIIDWDEKGAVGPVVNQGSCGSSALFATLGAVEGLGAVSTQKF